MRYYFDRRRNEIVNEDEINIDYLAPEVYYEYCENHMNYFIEVWCMENNKFLKVAYSTIDCEQGLVNDIRDEMFKKYNLEPIFLSEYYVPSEQFHQALKHFGLE